MDILKQGLGRPVYYTSNFIPFDEGQETYCIYESLEQVSESSLHWWCQKCFYVMAYNSTFSQFETLRN